MEFCVHMIRQKQLNFCFSCKFALKFPCMFWFFFWILIFLKKFHQFSIFLQIIYTNLTICIENSIHFENFNNSSLNFGIYFWKFAYMHWKFHTFWDDEKLIQIPKIRGNPCAYGRISLKIHKKIENRWKNKIHTAKSKLLICIEICIHFDIFNWLKKENR